MALDPSIPLQTRAPQMRSPLESAGRVMQLRDLAQGQRLGQEQLKRVQLANQQDEMAITAARDTEKFLADHPNASETELVQNLGTKAIPLLKARREQQKADIETQIKEFDLNTKKLNRFSEIAGTIGDEDTLVRGIGQAVSEGLIPRDEAIQYLNMPWNEQTAARVKQIGNMALTRAQQLEQERKAIEDQRAKLEFDAKLPGMQADSTTKQITAQQMQAQGMTDKDVAQIQQGQATLAQRQAEAAQRTKDAAASRAVTVAGQNKTDARQREMAEIARDTKPPGEAELRSLGFYERYKQANDVLDTLKDSKNISVAKLKLPDWMNATLNADEQAYKQAERQMIEAYLRRDSGAAIAESEYTNARRTLGLDFGDKKTTTEQKAKARVTHQDSLRASAGRAYAKRYGEPAIEPAATEQPAKPKVGAIVDGFVFVGGDPSQKSSWKKK